MAIPTSRDTFKDYCLRQLGFPVIQIEVDPEQIEDRIDDALNKYYDYHFDGVEEDYYVVHLTPTDITNNYLTLDEKIFSVVSVMPISNAAGYSGSSDLFNVQYQFYLNDFYGGTAEYSGLATLGGNLNYIETFKSYIATIQHRLTPTISFNFNRKTNKVFFNELLTNINMRSPILVFKVFKKLDVSVYTDVWNDEFLKEYATALIKRQWGSNLKKYGNLNLPGGLTINGDAIYAEAIEQITALEQKLINDLQQPADFLVG